MNREEIKQALSDSGSGVFAISTELGVRSATVTNVICRKGGSQRIESAIAAKINKPLHEVFPEKYKPEAV